MGGLMSTVKANDITNVTGGIPTVKSQQLIPTAWVNLNGTGTVAIRDSEGVSSVTDLATGQWRINFSTAMANINYCPLTGRTADSLGNGDNRWQTIITLLTTTHVDTATSINGNGWSFIDKTHVFVAIMGGQA